MKNFAQFLAETRVSVEPLEREAAEAWWGANIASTPDAEARAADAQKALTRFYANRDAFMYLRFIDPAALPPDEARQHQLLLNTYTANQIDDATIEEMVDTERRVESAYNNFRPILRGEPITDNAIRDIFRTSDDAALRQEAWAASKEIGREVEADVLRLVALRNREAQRLGYTNYYQMALSLQEIEQDELFALLADIAAQTDVPWQIFKADLDTRLAARFGVVAVADLRPWHYSDPFFQDAPPGAVDLDTLYEAQNVEALTVAFFDAIGLEVRPILARSDLNEKDGKSQHAFCLHVGRFDDVRVLCNNTPSERWMGTMLHEFGHAVYDQYLGDDLPFFLREVAHTLTTEAIAMLFGRLSRSAAFLVRYAGVAPEVARTVAVSAQAESSAQLLVFARWVLVMTHFERALYEDPTQNLRSLWWEMVGRFQGITPPNDRDAPDWAAKLHLALAPVYYHNYLMGEMFASQLTDYLHKKILPAGSGDDDLISRPEVGDYLRRAVFAPGARLPWNALIAAATDEPLNPSHFVGHL